MLGFVAHYEDKGEGGIGFLIGEIIIGIFALMITIARYDDLVKDDTTEDSTEIPQPIPEKTFDNSSPLKNLLRKI